MNQNKKVTSSPAKKNTNVQQAAERPFANVNIDSTSDQDHNKDSPKRNTNVQAAEGSSAAQRNITPERIQFIKEKYKSIRIPLRMQTATSDQSINESHHENNILSGQYLEYIINRIYIFY
jgi:hypothetical protein